jgi:pilus assembly protein TadC
LTKWFDDEEFYLKSIPRSYFSKSLLAVTQKRIKLKFAEEHVENGKTHLPKTLLLILLDIWRQGLKIKVCKL